MSKVIPTARPYKLPSRRERQVLQLIWAGLTTEEIAGQLTLSAKTIETHRVHLLRKARARNVVGLVRVALAQRWIGGLGGQEAPRHGE